MKALPENYIAVRNECAGIYFVVICMLLGHNDVKTTMIYTLVLNGGGHGARSLGDALESISHDTHKKILKRADDSCNC